MIHEEEEWYAGSMSREKFSWCENCRQRVARLFVSHLCPICDTEGRYECPWTEKRRIERKKENQ